MLRWKISFVVVAAMATALLGVAPAAAQTTDAKAFCDAVLKAETVVDKAFSSEKKPSPKLLQQVDQALTQAESTAPPEIAATVQSAAGILRNALQTGQDPFQTPTLEQNTKAIDEYRYNSCGYTKVDVTGLEYEFRGLPRTLKAGTVAIKFTDTGAELHEITVFRLKTKDSVKKVLQQGKKGEKKVEAVGDAHAAQGQTSYLIADLSKPGRYGAVCFLPVGSTSVEQLQGEHDHGGGGKPHWKEGMYAEVKVKKA